MEPRGHRHSDSPESWQEAFLAGSSDKYLGLGDKGNLEMTKKLENQVPTTSLSEESRRSHGLCASFLRARVGGFVRTFPGQPLQLGFAVAG